MKIGIMTFCTPEGHNYGQILQFYALQKYLRDQGHDAFIIRYVRINRGNPLWLKAVRALNPYIFVRHFYLKYKKFLDNKEAASPRYFEEFLAGYTEGSPAQYLSLDDLQKNPPEADVYIVGSDQVWNAEILRYDRQKIHAFFLDFGAEETPRVAYAASWGQGDFPAEYIKQVSPLLKKFQAVSVREKSGVELCRRAGYEGAKWVCDPTLLLTADDYRRFYNENPIRRREKKYILLYMLSDRDVDHRALNKFAEKKGLEILYVPAGSARLKNAVTIYPTLPEWLYLIDNAEYVITKSFHGSVFSTIFGKRYGAIPRVKNLTGRNTRIDSLFEMSNIEPRWLKPGEGFSILDRPYSADISSFRAESIRFLDDALKNIRER